MRNPPSTMEVRDACHPKYFRNSSDSGIFSGSNRNSIFSSEARSGAISGISPSSGRRRSAAWLKFSPTLDMLIPLPWVAFTLAKAAAVLLSEPKGDPPSPSTRRSAAWTSSAAVEKINQSPSTHQLGRTDGPSPANSGGTSPRGSKLHRSRPMNSSFCRAAPIISGRPTESIKLSKAPRFASFSPITKGKLGAPPPIIIAIGSKAGSPVFRGGVKAQRVPSMESINSITSTPVVILAIWRPASISAAISSGSLPWSMAPMEMPISKMFERSYFIRERPIVPSGTNAGMVISELACGIRPVIPGRPSSPTTISFPTPPSSM